MTSIYRVWDADGVLLYIGISNDWFRRLNQHAIAPWWQDMAAFHSDLIPEGEDPREVERLAIQSEHPFYNVMWAVPRPAEMPIPEGWVRDSQRALEAAQAMESILW